MATGVFRNGTFLFFQGSPNNQRQLNLGAKGDVALAADYDVDGKTDFAIYRPSIAQFSWVRSSDGVSTTIPAGNTGDIPLVGDFDGDGKTDIDPQHAEDEPHRCLHCQRNTDPPSATGA
jgi:hypothetical protein